MNNVLIHYGVKGMKWGVRKQYEGTGGGSGGGWGPNTIAGGGGPSPLAASMAGNPKKKKSVGKAEAKKMGVKDPGPEPEGYSAARQNKELQLKNAIKNAKSSKEKMTLQKEYNEYKRESKEKAKEYLKWEKAVKSKVGDTKNYTPIKEGRKFTGQWLNKHSGQIISNEEYWAAGNYDTLPFFKKILG